MLPNEELVQCEVGTECGVELRICSDILHFALDNILATDEQGNLIKIPRRELSGLSQKSLDLVLGLFAKACKQFRTILLLAERGFGSEAVILSRALFETAVAIIFILKEKVELKRTDNNQRIIYNPDPTKTLDSDFRALLYAGKITASYHNRYVDLAKKPELRHVLVNILPDSSKISKSVSQAESSIGNIWWNDMVRCKRYLANLSFKDICISLDVMAYHDICYGLQSDAAHASDGFDHFIMAEEKTEFKLSPSTNNIAFILRSMVGPVFLAYIGIIHERIGLGDCVDRKLDDFRIRLTTKTPQS